MATTGLTPPPSADDVIAPGVVTNDAGDVTGAPSSMKDRVLGAAGKTLSALGGRDPNTSPLDAAVQKHHEQKLAEIQMHRKNMATYGGILAAGIDPDTGQPLTDEKKQQYTHWYNLSKDAYTKAAGVNKDTKAAVQKSTAVVDHVIAAHPKPDAGGGAGGGPPNTAAMGPGGEVGLPNNLPSTIGGTKPTNLSAPSAGGAGLTPPPKVSADSQGPQLDPTIEAPRLRKLAEEQHADKREIEKYKAKEGYLYDLKMKEDAAKAAAKAANPSGQPGSMRPGPASSVRDARLLAKQGRVYNDIDGNPIDLNALPDSMGLKLMAQGAKHWYETFSPNSKVITVGNETYAINPMDVEALGGGAGTDLGQHNVGSTSASTDPSTGQTTVTRRTPGTTGVAGRGRTSPQGGGAAAQGSRRTSSRLPGPPSADGVPSAQRVPPLDKDDHIASGWTGAAPQVIEGANQLHDGKDMKEIGGTAKSKPLSEKLARETWGWSQDKFTPLEKTQIALATRYINEAAESPALKSLDRGFFAQLPMIGATGEGKTSIGKAMTKLSSMGTSPEQQEFLRIYRQLAGTISGLGKLSRGGRITEATVNRLLSELPNPTNTTSSKDAIERLNRLRDEVTTALSHDSFQELVGGRTEAGAKKGISGPPKSTPGLSEGARKYLEANP